MTYESVAGLIEMGFVYAVALGLGIWQVVKMRRELARDQARRERADSVNKDDMSDDKIN